MPATPRRILLVVHGFPPEFRGGTELYALKLAHALRKRGQHVAIVAGSMESRPECETERSEYESFTVWRIRRQGLFLDNWDKSWCPEVETELAKIVRAERPDVVHVHHWIRLTRTLIASLHGLGVPSVATLHDLWSSCARCFRVRDERLCVERMAAKTCFACVPHDPWQSEREVREELELFHADFQRELALARVVIVPSRAQQAMLAQQMALPADRFTVLEHGTIAELKATTPAPASKIRLGHWGNLYPMKGFHLLLEALQSLPETARARFSVDCWGRAFDADYKSKLDRLAVGLDVRWHGSYVPADLQSAELDWAVLPSMAFESWSFVLDEAFALGLPVIASRRGALGDRVGSAGLCFEPESTQALAAVLERIANDEQCRSRCAASVPRLNSMSEHAALLEEIYEQALASPAPTDENGAEVEARHRVHRSLVLEERLKEVLFLRGRVVQERDRADGLKNELARSDAAMSGHSALETDLQDSLRRFERELKEARADYSKLEDDHARLRRDKDAVIAGYEGSVAEYRAAVERAESDYRSAEKSVIRLQAELQKRDSALAPSAAEEELELLRASMKAHAEAWAKLNEDVVATEAQLCAAETKQRQLASDLEAARAEHAERESALQAESQRLTVALAHLDKELVDGERARGSLEESLLASRKAMAEIERSLAASIEDGRRHLQEANAARKQASDERSSAAQVQRELIERSREREEEQQRMLRASEARSAALSEELITTQARAAGMAATLSEAERVGNQVAADLSALAGSLGMAASAQPAHLNNLPELTRDVSAAVIQARNFLGELDSAVQRLTEEARAIESERADLDARLRGNEAEQERLRRSLVFRLAERWAGARKPAKAKPAARTGTGLSVLMVIHDFLPRHAAGSEIYTFNILQALKRRGHAVHLLTTEAHQGVHSYNVRETAVEGLSVTEVSHQHTTRYFDLSWRDVRMNRIFRETLERVRPDVLHIQHLHHHSIDYPAIAAEMGIPVVYTLHEYMLLCPRGGQMLRADGERCLLPKPEKCADCIAHLSLESVEQDDTTPRLASRIARHVPSGMKHTLKGLLGGAPEEKTAAPETQESRSAAIKRRLEAIEVMARSVDLFISPSEFLRQRFIEAGVAAPEQIVFSDNGQDSAPFGSVSRKPSATLRVGYIGTIADYKGLHVLTAAMDRLLEREDIRCDIHGSLTTAPTYAEDLKSHTKNPRTRFHGRFASHALPGILAEVDVLVVPSLWWENSPLTIHEAFMAGLPVIGSDIGGMAEFVRDGENGLLFRVGDPADLAEKIERFADDRALLSLLRNKVVPIRSIEEDAILTESRYRELLARKKGRSGA